MGAAESSPEQAERGASTVSHKKASSDTAAESIARVPLPRYRTPTVETLRRSRRLATLLPREASTHYCEATRFNACRETEDAYKNDLELCKWSLEDKACVRRKQRINPRAVQAVQAALNSEIGLLDFEIARPVGSDIRIILKKNSVDVSILASVSESPAAITEDKYVDIFSKVIDFCIEPSPEMCADPLSPTTGKKCVNEAYLRSRLFPPFTVILVMDVGEAACRKAGPGGDVRAFISFKMQEANTRMYVDLICTKHTNATDRLYYQVASGKILLKLAEAYAVSRYKAREIELEVIPSTMLYYPRFGFQYRKTCESDADLIPVPKELMAIPVKDLRKPENVARIKAFEARLIESGNGSVDTGPHMKKCLPMKNKT